LRLRTTGENARRVAAKDQTCNPASHAMTAPDDRRQSTAANVVDGIALGFQAVCEFAGVIIEGALTLLTVLG
jgi:hypothetical protein